MPGRSRLELPGVGECLGGYFKARGWDNKKRYRELSRNAGLDDQWAERTIKAGDGQKPRASLLKISTALDLTSAERQVLEASAGLPKGSLKATRAQKVEHDEISMRRAVLLLTAPTDPSLMPSYAQLPDVATRSGIVFGQYDVIVRVNTPEGLSVLEYADKLFKSKKLRTIETIPIRDDLPVYVDTEFSRAELHDGDYFWAVIFIEALTTRKTPEPRDIFRRVALHPEFKGSIHLLTAGVVVGQFDTVVEVLAAKLSDLQKYVRAAQSAANDVGRDVHTVTYPAWQWSQTPDKSF